MQIAKVVVIHKKGDNFLFFFSSKGIEKVIYTRIIKFVDKHNIIPESQFGFRKKRSTELALLDQK